MSEDRFQSENQTITLQRPCLWWSRRRIHLNLKARITCRKTSSIGSSCESPWGIPIELPNIASDHQPGRTPRAAGPIMTGEDIVRLQDLVPNVKLDSAIVDYILIWSKARATKNSFTGRFPTRRAALTQAGPSQRRPQWPRICHTGRCETPVHPRLRPTAS